MNKERTIRTLLCLALGAGTGIAVGVVFQDVIQGLIIGLILGAAYALLFMRDKRKTD